MIRWLQNYSGIQSIGENIEQTELENLRKEVKKYKKKYEKEDKEMEVSSEDDDDISPEEQKKIDEEMAKRKCQCGSIWYTQCQEALCSKSYSKNRRSSCQNKRKMYAKFHF